MKLDWNINEANKFSVRWSLVNAKQLNNAGGRTSLNDNLYSYPFKSVTNSVIAELQSRISPSVSNEARVSYVGVRDKRDVGAPFPSINISGVGGGTVNLGNERSSMANSLDQDIWTIEDNSHGTSASTRSPSVHTTRFITSRTFSSRTSTEHTTSRPSMTSTHTTTTIWPTDS